MSFIETLQRADANVLRAIEIMGGLRTGAADVSAPSRPEIGVSNMTGIFPPELLGGPVSIEDMVPHLPEGSTIINIPQGFDPVIVNGELTVEPNGDPMHPSFDESLVSFTVDSEHGQASLEFLQHEGSASASVVISGGKIIAQANANYEANLINAQGSAEFGPLSMQGSFNVGLETAAGASATLDPLKGQIQLAADAHLQIGAEVEAAAQLELELLGLNLGQVYAEGYAFAGAEVAGHAEATFDIINGQINVDAGFDAFAGAEAGFEAGIDTDLVDASVSGNLQAGIGASGNLAAGLNEDGVLEIEASLGLAIGIGAEIGFNVGIDVKNIKANILAAADNFSGAIDAIKEGDVGGAVNSALDSIENATEVLSDSVDTATDIASGVIEGIGDVVGGVADVLGLDFMENTINDITDFISGGIDTVGSFVADGIDFVGDKLDEFGNTAEAVLQPVTEFVQNIMDDPLEAIGGAIEDIGGSFIDTVEDVAGVVEDFVADPVGTLVSGVENIGNSIGNLFRSF